jgi:hypothetical protein
MTSQSFFIRKSVKEIQTKNPFDKILSLNFLFRTFQSEHLSC